jgi:hypothetical protein
MHAKHGLPYGPLLFSFLKSSRFAAVELKSSQGGKLHISVELRVATLDEYLNYLH